MSSSVYCALLLLLLMTTLVAADPDRSQRDAGETFGPRVVATYQAIVNRTVLTKQVQEMLAEASRRPAADQVLAWVVVAAWQREALGRPDAAVTGLVPVLTGGRQAPMGNLPPLTKAADSLVQAWPSTIASV